MAKSALCRSVVRRFGHDSRGAALVEFAIILPMMLLLFGMTIESARTFWSYQTAIVGVRDATRYLARAVPVDICASTPSGSSLSDYMPPTGLGGDDGGQSMFPPRVTVGAVSPVLDCRPGATVAFRIDPAPIATLSAEITIEFPLAGLFTMIGGGLEALTTTVRDESRIYGT